MPAAAAPAARLPVNKKYTAAPNDANITIFFQSGPVPSRALSSWNVKSWSIVLPRYNVLERTNDCAVARQLQLHHLLDHILAGIQNSAGNLPPQSDEIHWVILAQTAENRHLRSQHITFSYGSNHFSRRRFYSVHSPRHISLRHGNGQRSRRFSLVRNQLLRAKQRGLHCIDLNDNVGQCRHYFLLILQCHHVFLAGCSCCEQRNPPGICQNVSLIREWTFIVARRDGTRHHLIH